MHAIGSYWPRESAGRGAYAYMAKKKDFFAKVVISATVCTE